MTNDSDVEELLRYLSGELSPEKTSEIEARLRSDAELRAQLDAWRQVRESRPAAWDTERALMAVQRQLGHGDRRRSVRLVAFPDQRTPRKRRVAVYALRVAAALVIGAGVATAWRMERAQQSDDGVTAPVTLREYLAPRGRRAVFRLPDGTKVILAAETRLRISPDFGQRNTPRDVQLEGEAYFEVTHDEARPFFVRTATSIVEDLGTRFAVRAYPMEKAVEVVVAEGLVAVESRHLPTLGTPKREVLEAGQLARLEISGDLHVQRDIDLRQHLAWTEGVLSFDQHPFGLAAADVERWYDIDVRLADSALGQRRISGSFGNEPLDAVLGYLALALDARYERQGRVVTFFPGRRTH